MGGDDGARERRGAVQPDAHALAAAEHLEKAGKTVRQRRPAAILDDKNKTEYKIKLEYIKWNK